MARMVEDVLLNRLVADLQGRGVPEEKARLIAMETHFLS